MVLSRLHQGERLVFQSRASNQPRRSRLHLAMRGVASLTVAALLTASLLSASIARADDQDTIDYRQHIMNTIGDQMLLINQIIHKQAPADGLAAFAQILALNAALAPGAFMQNVAGGDSKATVWTNWKDFSKQLQALVDSSNDLAMTAKSGDLTMVATKVAALNCMGCHDVYVQKK